MRYYFLFFVLCVFVAGCGNKDIAPHNPMGLSGRRSPEAEAAFAKAHVLWNKQDVCTDPYQARIWLDEAVRLDPGYAEAYLRRGLARGELKDWDGGFDDLSKAIRLAPTAEAYAYRGLISMRSGNRMGARKDFDKSIAIAKRQHRAWNYRGALNLLEGNRAQACKDFENGCDYGDCVGLESAQKSGECPR